jgi:septum formation inhibitor MinC
MKTGTVAIKGTRDGLLVSIGEKAEISTLKRALHEKMQLAGNFFNGARVTVDMGSRVLTADEVKQLETIICDEYGMMLVKILPQQKESVDESTNTKAFLCLMPHNPRGLLLYAQASPFLCLPSCQARVKVNLLLS